MSAMTETLDQLHMFRISDERAHDCWVRGRTAGYCEFRSECLRKLAAELRETRRETREASSVELRSDCIYSAISLILSAEELGIIDNEAGERLSRWATTWRIG